MTGPYSRFFKDDPAPTPPAQSQGSVYDRFFKSTPAPKPEATIAAPSKQEGFLDYLGNFAASWMKVGDVNDKIKMERMHIPVSYDPSELAIKTQMLKGQGEHASGIAMHDFVNFFGQMFKDTGAQLKKVVENPGETLEAIRKDPIGTAGQFGKAFVTPLADLAELDSGVHLTTDDFTALTPVEKADRIKSAAATGAMLATGTAAGKVVGRGLTALDALNGIDEASLGISRLVPKGELARKALKGTIEAGAGGSAYGLVRHANEADQLSETLINGVIFAPLGAAFELLHKGEPTEVQAKQTPAKTAHQLSEIRQLGADDLSFKGVMNTVDAMSTADDLSEAVVKSHIANKEPFIHLDGMPSENVGKLSLHVPDNYEMAHHLAEDGTANVLVYDKKYAPHVDKKFFAENGVAENQIVSLNGNDSYVVTGGDGRRIDLTNSIDPSDRVTVPRDAIRTPTRFKLDVRAANDEEGSLLVTHKDKPIYGNADKVGKGLTISPSYDMMMDRAYASWKSSAFEKQPTPIEQLQEKRAQLATKPGPELDIVEEQLRRIEAKTNGQDPIGFDDMPPESILDETNNRNLSDHIDNFLEKQKVDPVFRDSYKKQLEARLRGEAIAQLPEEDRVLIMQPRVTETTPIKPETTTQISVDQLTRKAKSNNMSISDGGSGRVIVRDLQSRRILGGFDDYNKASAFIDKTGQASGINLDAGGPISGDVAGGGRGLPPDDPQVRGNDFPYKYNPAGGGTKWEYLARGLDNVASFTRIRDWTALVDTKYNTKFYTGIVEPLQRLLGARNAEMTPWIEKGAAVEKLIGKLSESDREKVGEWLQTMTPQQVVSGFMSRPMNDLEQALGRQVADSKVDLERVFPYMREVEKLEKEFLGSETTPDKQREYGIRVQQAREAYGIGDGEMGVVGMFNAIVGMNKREASLGAIVRLARSISDGELDRNTFAKRHGLSAAQLEAGKQLEGLYTDLGDHFGIPKESRLGGYMTHARLYTDGNISEAMKHFSGDVEAKNFYAKLARTGEISAYEKDPIRALFRYVKGGFDQKSGFNQAFADARNAAVEEAKKLPGLAQGHVVNTIDHFMDDVRGFPAASDKFAQDVVDHYMDQFGLTKDVDLRGQLVNTILSTFHAAMIGGRPIIGLAHASSAMMVSIADRGIGYTNRMLKSGMYARLHPEILESIRKEGGLSTISPIWQYSKAQFDQRAALSRAFSKGAMMTSEALFKLTGLPDIFETFSSGHFLTAKADALKAITSFNRKEISWSQLKRDTFLDKFYAPISKQFTTLVKAGKVEEAANLLGRETVNDLIGIFGDASHPTKWGTNWGRVLGQYGNWPLWLRSTVTRGVSRGTVGQRIAFAAKLGALGFGAEEAGKKIGINLAKLNPLEALGWIGGPALGMAVDAGMAIKGQGYAAEQAKRRLMRDLPIDPRTGKLQASPFIPGSFAIDGLVHAARDFSQGNVGEAIGETLGFRKYSIRR